MPARSSLYSYTPEEQLEFSRKLRFVVENKSRFPSLARSVAEEVGCTAPNVYSVLKGSTFNAHIVRVAYAQICRAMGILQHDTTPQKGNSLDEEMVRDLAEAQTLRGAVVQDLLTYRDIRNKILRQNFDLSILDFKIQRRLSSFPDGMSDMVATEASGYLQETAGLTLSPPPSHAIDLQEMPKLGSTADVPQEILDFIERAKMDGLLTEDGLIPEDPETAHIGIGHNITDLLPDPV